MVFSEFDIQTWKWIIFKRLIINFPFVLCPKLILIYQRTHSILADFPLSPQWKTSTNFSCCRRLKISRLIIKEQDRYRVFIKYCVFSFKIYDFSELCQFFCSAGVLPAWRVYTHWHRGKTEKGQSPEYFKIFKKKNTISNTCAHMYIHWHRGKTGKGQSPEYF